MKIFINYILISIIFIGIAYSDIEKFKIDLSQNEVPINDELKITAYNYYTALVKNIPEDCLKYYDNLTRVKYSRNKNLMLRQQIDFYKKIDQSKKMILGGRKVIEGVWKITFLGSIKDRGSARSGFVLVKTNGEWKVTLKYRYTQPNSEIIKKEKNLP